MVRIYRIRNFGNGKSPVDVIDIRQVARDIVSENKHGAVRIKGVLDVCRTRHRNDSAITSLAIAPHPHSPRNFSKRNAETQIFRLCGRGHDIHIATAIKLNGRRFVAIATALDDALAKDAPIGPTDIICNRRILEIAKPVRDPFLDVTAHIAKLPVKARIRADIFRFEPRILRIPFPRRVPVTVSRHEPLRFGRQTISINFRMEHKAFHRNTVPVAIKRR